MEGRIEIGACMEENVLAILAVFSCFIGTGPGCGTSVCDCCGISHTVILCQCFLLIAGPARSPSSSIFFINLMMFRCLVGIPMRMVIPHPGIRFYIFRFVATVWALTEHMPYVGVD